MLDKAMRGAGGQVRANREMPIRRDLKVNTELGFKPYGGCLWVRSKVRNI
jgi:hypothetical protein